MSLKNNKFDIFKKCLGLVEIKLNKTVMVIGTIVALASAPTFAESSDTNISSAASVKKQLPIPSYLNEVLENPDRYEIETVYSVNRITGLGLYQRRIFEAYTGEEIGEADDTTRQLQFLETSLICERSVMGPPLGVFRYNDMTLQFYDIYDNVYRVSIFREPIDAMSTTQKLPALPHPGLCKFLQPTDKIIPYK